MKEPGPVKYPKRVAIVDDDQQLLVSLSGLLRSFGIDALTFRSAAEFLEARPSPVDCLVADVHMPGMNGLEMIEKLRKDGETLPIIVLSALDPEATRNEALARGADAYFAKPVNSDELMKCMAQIMNSGSVNGD
jgi:DNA-binding response OmpR family regulator